VQAAVAILPIRESGALQRLYVCVAEGKARLSETIDEIATTHERVTATGNGRPVAVLVSSNRLRRRSRDSPSFSTHA
jgi:prevent-host-death family protein